MYQAPLSGPTRLCVGNVCLVDAGDATDSFAGGKEGGVTADTCAE